MIARASCKPKLWLVVALYHYRAHLDQDMGCWCARGGYGAREASCKPHDDVFGDVI